MRYIILISMIVGCSSSEREGIEDHFNWGSIIDEDITIIEHPEESDDYVLFSFECLGRLYKDVSLETDLDLVYIMGDFFTISGIAYNGVSVMPNHVLVSRKGGKPLPDTALTHEIAHVILDQVKGDPDSTHIDSRMWQQVVNCRAEARGNMMIQEVHNDHTRCGQQRLYSSR